MVWLGISCLALGTRAKIGANNHLPPQGIVAIIPLTNVTDLSGPTEFVAGSHVNLGIDYWVRGNRTRTIVLPCALCPGAPETALAILKFVPCFCFY